MLRHLALALCASTGALAQTRTNPDKPTTTTSEASETHTVLVGWAGSKFTPNETFAEVGDVVEFKFYPPDHSVVRAHYKHGCIPFESVGANSVGFYSGPQILSGISEDMPIFRIDINDTEPIFYFCGATGSCMHKHMIGAINPTAEESLEGHLEYVEQAEFELLPGDDWPSEAPPVDEDDGKSGSDSDSVKPPDTTKPDTQLSAGVIAGIAIGSAAVLIIAAGIVFLCGRRGGIDLGYRRSLALPWGGGRPPAGHSGRPDPFPAGGGLEHKGVTPMVFAPAQDWRVGSPPLVSPGYSIVGQQAYGPTVASHWTGTSDGNPRTVSQMLSPPLPDAPPAELPASADPGNSPLPPYRTLSWTRGGESEYRPGPK